MIQTWYATLKLRECLKYGLVELLRQEDCPCSFDDALNTALKALRKWDDKEQGESSLMKLWTSR